MAETLLNASLENVARASKEKPFDCLIVGGGTSGLTSARTLAERGLRVALFESGPAPFLTHISNTELRFTRALSDNVRNQVQYGPPLASGGNFGPNFGCLGGRGLFWNGASPRLRDHDFEGWPLAAQDLATEFAWGEREFRVSHALSNSPTARAILDGLKASGFDAQPAPFALDLVPPTAGSMGAGIASGLGMFLRGAGGLVTRQLISISTVAQARRILLAEAGVAGLAVSPPDRPDAVHEIMGRSVILAGGPVESVRLASLSGLPDRGKRIGLGLQDHHFYRCYFNGPHLYPADRPDNGAVYIPSNSQTSEQWEFHAPGRRLLSLDDGTAWQPAASDAYQLMVRSFCATSKRDENRVEVKDGPPGSAVIHFAYDDHDLAARAQMEANGARIGTALGLTQVEARFLPMGNSYHEAGGLDMGRDPETSVTNAHGAFHDLTRVVVADAASWPRIGATNPHLTTLAMARRQSSALADRLLSDT